MYLCGRAVGSKCLPTPQRQLSRTHPPQKKVGQMSPSRFTALRKVKSVAAASHQCNIGMSNSARATHTRSLVDFYDL